MLYNVVRLINFTWQCSPWLRLSRSNPTSLNSFGVSGSRTCPSPFLFLSCLNSLTCMPCAQIWCRDPHKHTLDDHRVHIYDVFNNALSETRRIPEQTSTVFGDFKTDALDEGCHAALQTAEQAFTRLENEVERILAVLAVQIRARINDPALISDSGTASDAECRARRFELPMSKRERDALLRYFVFLRYRNSEAYKETVGRLTWRVVVGETIVQARHAWHRVRRRAVLGSFHAFLHRDGDGRATHAPAQAGRRFESEGFDCWRFLEAEVCFGVASEEQQFVLPDTCFASLDGDFGSDP